MVIRRIDIPNAEQGMSIPSPPEIIDTLLDRLVRNGIIGTKKYFSDAGCATGMVLASANAHSLPSFGAEYNPELFGECEFNIGLLRDQGAVSDEYPLIMSQGNFLEDATYDRAGVSFGDIGTFFNYDNNDGNLASRVAECAAPGTILVVLDRKEEPKSFPGLAFVDIVTPGLPEGVSLAELKRSNPQDYRDIAKRRYELSGFDGFVRAPYEAIFCAHIFRK